MEIAVASGKGGTGKTTVALALASSFEGEIIYLDCDVEEPNAHLFLNPEVEKAETVYSFVPLVDESKCTLCGKCEDICRFSSIVIMGKKLVTYPAMCHGCRGCELVCPEKAITAGKRELGTIAQGRSGNINLLTGRLRIGEAMSPPLIKHLKSLIPESAEHIISDAPPGASCPMVATVRDADFVLLVTEPTPFGINDLSIAFEALKEMNLPCGLIINRSMPGNMTAHEFAEKNNIRILFEIPDDRVIAEGYSRGALITETRPELKSGFISVFKKIGEIISAGREA